jgi:FG-GAP repeat
MPYPNLFPQKKVNRFNMKTLLLTISCLLSIFATQAQSISATYTAGLIPTSFNTYDNSCNGPSATLSLTLPAGESYTVTSVDVSYTMTGFGSGWKSHQRSMIKLQNTNVEEAAEAIGVGDVNGTQTYARSISIANGNYAGGTELVFQMKARRTQEGNPGCNNLINRVDNNTWVITVHYTPTGNLPKLGINTSSPTQTMEVAGKLKLGDDLVTPQAGTVRWNATSHNFEGFNGTEWLSLTKNAAGNWGKTNVNENQQFSPAEGRSNDQFGSAVAISGDHALVGAFTKDIGAVTDQGKVYVFKRTGNTWAEQGFLVAPDGAVGDFFGTSVAISGDYAIVGAYGRQGAGQGIYF